MDHTTMIALVWCCIVFFLYGPGFGTCSCSWYRHAAMLFVVAQVVCVPVVAAADAERTHGGSTWRRHRRPVVTAGAHEEWAVAEINRRIRVVAVQ